MSERCNCPVCGLYLEPPVNKCEVFKEADADVQGFANELSGQNYKGPAMLVETANRLLAERSTKVYGHSVDSSNEAHAWMPDKQDFSHSTALLVAIQPIALEDTAIELLDAAIAFAEGESNILPALLKDVRKAILDAARKAGE